MTQVYLKIRVDDLKPIATFLHIITRNVVKFFSELKDFQKLDKSSLCNYLNFSVPEHFFHNA